MRLVFDPPARAGEVQDTGPWALFRLIGRGKLQPQAGAADRYTLTFQVGERQVVFEIRVLAANPLAPGLLTEFRCPSIKAAG